MPLRCVCDTDLTSGRVCTPADRGSPPLGSGARPGRLGPKVTKRRPPPGFLCARYLVLGPGAGARSRWGREATGAGGGPAPRAFSPRPAAAGRRRQAAGHLVSFSAGTRGSGERAPGPAEGPGPGGRGGAGSRGGRGERRGGAGRGRGRPAPLTGTDRFGPDAGGGLLPGLLAPVPGPTRASSSALRGVGTGRSPRLPASPGSEWALVAAAVCPSCAQGVQVGLARGAAAGPPVGR